MKRVAIAVFALALSGGIYAQMKGMDMGTS